MITYIFKSSLSLIVLFGLYWFFLRKEKLFVFNRYFLVLAIVFSLLLPFLSIPVNVQVSYGLRTFIPEYDYSRAGFSNATSILLEGSGINQTSPEKQYSRMNGTVMLIALYITGVVLLLIRFLRNLFLIEKKAKSGEKIRFKGYKIILTSEKMDPCCFFRSIYLNRDEYLNGTIDNEFLDHEREHARQSHTIDILFLELVKIFYWFNPVYILYDRAIRINHEYLADNGVIRDKSDIKSYADKLLNFITHRINLPLASGTYHSFTRKRLTMMMRPISGNFFYTTRIGITVCLATLVFLLLSFKETYNEPLKHNLSGSGSELIQKNVRGIVTTEGGLPLYAASIKTISSQYDSVETTTDFEGRFTIDNALSGASLLIRLEGFKQRIVVVDTKSEMNIKMVRDPDFKQVLFIPIVHIVKFRNSDFTPAQGLLVINGKTVDSKGELKVDPNKIRSLMVLTGKEAINKYGDKAQDGVFEIELYGFRSTSSARKSTMKEGSDSSRYTNHIAVNNVENKGEPIDLPVSGLQEVAAWTYYDMDKKIKDNLPFIAIMTRDFYKVKGIVTTEKGKPLPCVKITDTGNPVTEISDKDGRFLMEDVRVNTLLQFSLSGYKPYNLATTGAVYTMDLKIELQKENFVEWKKIYEKVEKMPQYPGGEGDLQKFIATNVNFPAEAFEQNAQGTVIARFVITTQGNIEDVQIVQRVHPAIDTEVLRVIGKLGKFIPGSQGGKPVNVYYTLPVTFMTNRSK